MPISFHSIDELPNIIYLCVGRNFAISSPINNRTTTDLYLVLGVTDDPEVGGQNLYTESTRMFL
jgi:hypothetical protein